MVQLYLKCDYYNYFLNIKKWYKMCLKFFTTKKNINLSTKSIYNAIECWSYHSKNDK